MEMMKDCQEIYDFLIEYQERTLPFYERMRFKLHLMACSRCSDYMKVYQKSSELFRKALVEDPPPQVLMDLTMDFIKARRRSPAD